MPDAIHEFHVRSDTEYIAAAVLASTSRGSTDVSSIAALDMGLPSAFGRSLKQDLLDGLVIEKEFVADSKVRDATSGSFMLKPPQRQAKTTHKNVNINESFVHAV